MTSAAEHAFGQGEPLTLGVEEEYMLLDGTSFDLVQHIDSVLAAVEHSEHRNHIHAELMQSVLEVTTPVCRTAGDVMHSLADIGKAKEKLGYAPTHDVARGIKEALAWYVKAAKART